MGGMAAQAVIQVVADGIAVPEVTLVAGMAVPEALLGAGMAVLLPKKRCKP